ncbi:MAG: hypothetical protein CMN75_12720 [Spirochaeta sp.]|nr:hypothetical protein [Spirochaeta sp.]RPG14189.1 MAG: DUF3450 family protein [Proteobacteria bacterium TMED72]
MTKELFWVGLSLLAPAFLLHASPVSAEQGEGLQDFRSKLEKWVEVRQIISKEESDWAVDQESLEATRSLLKAEIEDLQVQVEELDGTSVASDQERRELILSRARYQRGESDLKEQLRLMEEEALALIPQLPPPLRKKLEPLLVQIPENPESTNLGVGQRLMSVLGLLAQAEKFNGTATFVGETRAIGGQKVQVRTLYWGLGQAISVDSLKRTAGTIRPVATGWEFEEEAGLAEQAALLLDIYEGNVDVVDFVEFPVRVD